MGSRGRSVGGPVAGCEAPGGAALRRQRILPLLQGTENEYPAPATHVEGGVCKHNRAPGDQRLRAGITAAVRLTAPIRLRAARRERSSTACSLPMNDGTACAAFENHPPAVGNQIGLIVEDWRPASLGLARRRFVKPTRDVHEGALVESHTRAGRNRLGPEGQTGSGLTITGRLLSAIHARLQRHDYRGRMGNPRSAIRWCKAAAKSLRHRDSRG